MAEPEHIGDIVPRTKTYKIILDYNHTHRWKDIIQTKDRAVVGRHCFGCGKTETVDTIRQHPYNDDITKRG